MKNNKMCFLLTLAATSVVGVWAPEAAAQVFQFAAPAWASGGTEHSAVMDLVSGPTHEAIASGGWTEPSTWDPAFGVPGPGARVLIPSTHTVTMNTDLVSGLQTVNVQGGLYFPNGQSCDFHVDTLLVGMTGQLRIGNNLANPMPEGSKVRLIIDDTEAFDPTDPLSSFPPSDPLTIGQGLIVMGTLRMYGAPRTAFATLVGDAQAGDDTLYFDDLPNDWMVGDRLVIGGTQSDAKGDEELEILSVDYGANSVTFADFDTGSSPMLTKDHKRPASTVTHLLRIHVANLTRNVSVETEFSKRDAKVTGIVTTHPHANATVPGTDLPVMVATTGEVYPRRGHVMCMSPQFDVRHVGFYGLGRTNKMIALEDSVLGSDCALIGTAGRNQRGRYSFHAHKTGTDPGSGWGSLHGCAVSDSPGWGFVNHSSKVHITDCVAYDTTGAGFASEAGDELGSFVGNIAIKNHGTGETVLEEDGRDQNPDDIRDDWGHRGSGFWFQGAPGLVVTDNVASGSLGEAFAVYADPILPGARDVDVANLHNPHNYPEQLKHVDSGKIRTQAAPCNIFENNIAYGSVSGFGFFSSDSSDNLEQSVVSNCTAWSVQIGKRAFYTDGYYFNDLALIGDLDWPAGLAVDSHHGTGNVIYKDAIIEGWVIGLQVPRNARSNGIYDCYFNNLINVVVDPGRYLSNPDGSDIHALELTISKPTFGYLSTSAVAHALGTVDGCDITVDGCISRYEKARRLNLQSGEQDRHKDIHIEGQVDIYTHYDVNPASPHQNAMFCPIYVSLIMGDYTYRIYSEAQQDPKAVLFPGDWMNSLHGPPSKIQKDSDVPSDLWDRENHEIAQYTSDPTSTYKLVDLLTTDHLGVSMTYEHMFKVYHGAKINLGNWILAPGGCLLPNGYEGDNASFIDPEDTNTLRDGRQLRLLNTVLEEVARPRISVRVGGSDSLGNWNFSPGETVLIDISNLGEAPLDVEYVALDSGSEFLVWPEDWEYGRHLSLWEGDSAGRFKVKWTGGTGDPVKLCLKSNDPLEPIHEIILTGGL